MTPDLNIDNYRRGDLYNDTGKWKYDVWLHYGGPDFNYNNHDLWEEARKALRRATAMNMSGVTISEVSNGWMLVVREPMSKFEHPIMVIGRVTE